ncbi:hypothetical protein D3C71_1625740 [compost metagenome]
MQRTQPMSISPASRHLSCVSLHAATQTHDLWVEGRFDVGVVPQDGLEQRTLQWLGPDRLLKPRALVDLEAQSLARRVGQGMQDRRIKIVGAVQLLILRVPRLVAPVFSQHQYLAHRCILCADTVLQYAVKTVLANFQAQVRRPTRQGFQ